MLRGRGVPGPRIDDRTFLRTIRGNPNIKGNGIPSLPMHKIAAYAYDLFISQTRITLPNLQKAFEEFADLYHFKINLMNKFLRQRDVEDRHPNFPFKWTTDGIKYLGTRIPRDLSNVFTLKFSVLKAVKSELNRW